MAAWVYQQNKAIGLPRISSLTKAGISGWPISVSPRELFPDMDQGDIFLPVQTTTQVEGVLYVGARADHQVYSLYEARLLVSLANLAATFLERRRLEKTAGKADALREADRLKSVLISSVSHELKTPLAAITAAVSSRLEDDLAWDPVAVRTEFTAINENLERLNDSISGLLDLSRLQADAWRMHRDWYEIGEIIADTLRSLPANARQRITFAIPDDVPMIKVDFQQWSRVLQHLLENAFAYAPAGSMICVGADATAHDVRIWVEDSGPGIPPEERERIFEKFYRGASAALAPSGTGLGLAITTEIVRFHGGRIWVEDVQPRGARFVIALPCDGPL
jgi:two-component system sensor histidine kinase KdpD